MDSDHEPLFRGINNTFSFRNVHSMLDKLDWEIKEFSQTPGDDLATLSYRSANCALTAWHVGDWFYHEIISQTERGSYKGPEEYCAEMARLCPAIAIVRKLTNTFKHRQLRKNHDPHISTEVWFHATPGAWPDENGEYPDRDIDPSPEWWFSFHVLSAGSTQEALTVFQEARAFWQGQLEKHVT